MDKDNSFSFGLGIWPKKTYVNGKVKVLIEDWGIEPKMFLKKGKARVWGFEIVEDLR